MSNLTKSGIGSFLFGFFGNILIGVYPMTEWEMSKEVARLIVWLSLGFMLFGVILILASFSLEKHKHANEQFITNEMLRVYRGEALNGLNSVAISEFKDERQSKSLIINKLKEIDDYLIEIVNAQDLHGNELMVVSREIFRWYDWIGLIVVFVIYYTPFLRSRFKNTQVKYVVRWATVFNVALKKHGLGTLPTLEKDGGYLSLYRDIIQLELGLPFSITSKIHRNILLSASLNSLRVLKADSSFWKEMEAKKMQALTQKSLAMIRDAWGMFMVLLDSSISGLRSEIEQDIKRYINS
jgi:hypothetical protein